MSKLTKVPIDQAFKNRLKSRGYSVDDLEQRFPTHNDFPSKVLNLKNGVSLGRVGKLIQARTGHQWSDRVRMLPWIAPFLGCAGWPDHAAASDHHPEIIMQSPVIDGPISIAIDSVGGWFRQIDFSDPVLATAILGGLLMTQSIAIFQRRAISKNLIKKHPSDQLSLFPEMIEDYLPSKQCGIWGVDAATRQGQVRSENQDALNTLTFEDGTRAIIVCDGAGGIGGGAEASQSARDAITTSLQETWNERGKLVSDDLESAIATARKTAAASSLEGITTALLVLLVGNQVHYATLGDGAVSVIWPDGMVGHLQVPHHSFGRPSNEIGAYVGGDCDEPARTGTVRLEPGSIVLAMTDGASDLFNFEDFAGERDTIRNLTGWSDGLLAQLEAARDPETGAWLHSDNMTLAMAQLNMRASDDQTH